MDIRAMFRQTKAITPATQSEIDRLRAEREHEANGLPRAKEQRIAELDRQIESLATAEETARAAALLKEAALAEAAADLESGLQALVRTLVKARGEMQALVARHDSIITRFADLTARQRGQIKVTGLANRDLFILAGAESPLFQTMLGEYEALSFFLKDAWAAGLSIPEPPAAKPAISRAHTPMKIAPNTTATQAADLQDERAAIEQDRIKKIRNRKAA